MAYESNKKRNTSKNFDDIMHKKGAQKLSSLSNCIDRLKVEWQKDKSIAALWKDWRRGAG